MDYKTGFLVLTVLAGCFAIPTPEDDMSKFFEHVDMETRIVGGSTAPAGSHPHMVAMTSGLLVRSFMCGASLISTRTVLTAAHCIEAAYSWGALSSSLRITLGTNNWSIGGQTYTLERNVTHPNYLSSTIKNDIGVLITSFTVQLSNVVQPIRITYNHIGGGVPSRVAGWGRIVAGGALAASLLELDLDTLDGNDCVARAEQASVELNMRAPPVEPHIEVCTFRARSFGTCNGDSGSALALLSTGEQFGIVSWGFPCALGAPDMFVRVSAYQAWLQSVIV